MTFGELESDGTEDELAAERAAARATTARGFTHRSGERPRRSLSISGGDRAADDLRALWRQSSSLARRGRDEDTGNCVATLEGNPNGAGEVLLPRPGEDQPGRAPFHRSHGMRRPARIGHDHVGKFRPASGSRPPCLSATPPKGCPFRCRPWRTARDRSVPLSTPCYTSVCRLPSVRGRAARPEGRAGGRSCGDQLHGRALRRLA